MKIHIYILLLNITCLIYSVSGYVTYAAEGDGISCHTITNQSMVTSMKYGSAINLFDNGNKPLMRVVCNGSDSATAFVGNGLPTHYIYKYGHKKVGGKWEKTKFSGDTVRGSWIIGTAYTELDGVKEGEIGKVLAYICQKVSGQWKCGCEDEACKKPKWQLQTYSVPKNSNEGGTEVSENISGVDVHSTSKVVAIPNEKVTLKGVGFSRKNENDILWNGKKIETVTSYNGAEINITVPNLTPGKYMVNVRVGDAVGHYPVIMWIGISGEAPHISTITPNNGKQGDLFTLSGGNFTNNNDVLTSLGEFTKVSSSDGNTASFRFTPYETDWKQYTSDGKSVTREIEVFVTLVNVYGISNTTTFILKI